MRRFFPFRSFTSSADNGKAAPANDAMNENKVDESGTSSASRSPGARPFRSRSRHRASRNEESSHPQLRRSFSLSSSVIDRSLDEQMMSYSRDIPCYMSNDSDAPGHFGEVECYTWFPEKHPSRREYTTKVPNSHGFHETDSSHSRCQSCSKGHSPVSSPVALKSRSARFTNLFNKSEVLDLYIDSEQEVTRLNEKHNQKFPIRSTAPYLGQGRPPRPHSTAPSSPKLCKEIIESPSNIDIDDAWHSQLAEGGSTTHKVASTCHGGSHDTRHFKVSSERLSDFEESRSQTIQSEQDIYDHEDHVASATSRYFATDVSRHEESHGVHDFSLEQDTDENLLQRAKEVDACFMVPPVENSNLKVLRDKEVGFN